MGARPPILFFLLPLLLLTACGGGGGGRQGSPVLVGGQPSFSSPRATVENSPTAEVFLTWEQQAQATAYRVFRRIGFGGAQQIGEFSCPQGLPLAQCAPRYQDTGLPGSAQGQSIAYSVEAVAGTQVLGRSPERVVTTEATWRAVQRGDVSGRGITPQSLAVPPTSAYQVQMSGPIVGTPAVDVASGVVVVATANGDGRGTVRAMKLSGPRPATNTGPDVVADTSHILWTTELSGQVVSSPTIADGVIFIGGRDNTVTALSLATGSIIWQFFTKDDVGSSPVVAYGRVFIGAGNPLTGTGNLDRALYVLDAFPDDNGDGVLDDKDLDEGLDDPPGVSYDLLFKVETGDAVAGTPSILGGTVVVGGVDDRLYLIDAFTGQSRNIFIGTAVVATPALKRVTTCNGQTAQGLGIFVGTRDRFLHYLDQGPGVTPTLCWQVPGLQGDVLGGASLAEGRVIFGVASNAVLEANKVYAVDETTGNPVWAAPFSSPDNSQIANGPLVAGTQIWLSTGNPTTLDRASRLVVLSLAGGNLLWQDQVGIPMTSPILVGGFLLTGGTDGKIRAWK